MRQLRLLSQLRCHFKQAASMAAPMRMGPGMDPKSRIKTQVRPNPSDLREKSTQRIVTCWTGMEATKVTSVATPKKAKKVGYSQLQLPSCLQTPALTSPGTTFPLSTTQLHPDQLCELPLPHVAVQPA